MKKLLIVLLGILASGNAMAIGQVAICGSERESIRASLIGGIFNSEGKYPVGGHVTLPSGQRLYFSEIQIVERRGAQPSRLRILEPQNSGVDLLYNFENKRLTALSVQTGEELAQTTCSRMTL